MVTPRERTNAHWTSPLRQTALCVAIGEQGAVEWIRHPPPPSLPPSIVFPSLHSPISFPPFRPSFHPLSRFPAVHFPHFLSLCLPIGWSTWVAGAGRRLGGGRAGRLWLGRGKAGNEWIEWFDSVVGAGGRGEGASEQRIDESGMVARGRVEGEEFGMKETQSLAPP